jgi:hypothetical protein
MRWRNELDDAAAADGQGAIRLPADDFSLGANIGSRVSKAKKSLIFLNDSDEDADARSIVSLARSANRSEDGGDPIPPRGPPALGRGPRKGALVEARRANARW